MSIQLFFHIKVNFDKYHESHQAVWHKKQDWSIYENSNMQEY